MKYRTMGMQRMYRPLKSKLKHVLFPSNHALILYAWENQIIPYIVLTLKIDLLFPLTFYEYILDVQHPK